MKSVAACSFLEVLDEVSEAVESGVGLFVVVRAVSRVFDVSVIVLDVVGGMLVVVCQFIEDECAVLVGESGSESVELCVAEVFVGQLCYCSRGDFLQFVLLWLVINLIGFEVEWVKAFERVSEAVVGDFLGDLLVCKVTDRENIVAWGSELGCDLSVGASMLVIRARLQHPEEGDWRAWVLTVAERGVCAIARSSLAVLVYAGWTRHGSGGLIEDAGRCSERELVILTPGSDAGVAKRVAAAALRELEAVFFGFMITVACSRHVSDPADLHRAGAEAMFAANVVEARGLVELLFEEIGAYCLLLLVMSEDLIELQGFFDEMVAPFVVYDEQYEIDLVCTLEIFLDVDGNVVGSVEWLFIYWYMIRYCLECVKELIFFDVGLMDGCEWLLFGFKVM